VEVIGRLAEPPEVASSAVLIFGAIGLAANASGIVVLTRGGRSSGNVNMRAALLEVVNDALGSAAYFHVFSPSPDLVSTRRPVQMASARA
jgi:cobalt-zinc-cadmium efflux system protein